MKAKINGILTLILALFVHVSFAQDRTISGVVSDESGPLAGVNILKKGTLSGTETDFDGRYSIGTKTGEVLVFSFIGMKSVERTVGSSNTIDVTLEVDDAFLEEVVVTGIGVETSRRKVAIAVESVLADDLKSAPVSDISQALIGKIPGASIQSTTGQPGQQQSIILRGINSLGSSQPMILVDGLQINTDNLTNGSNGNYSSRFADLDLSDIERVEVIQGAAAGTIYGAQGANGVIQIFTKQGKQGELKVSFRSNISVSEVLRGKFGKTNFHYFDTTTDGFLAANAAGDRLFPDSETLVWGNPIGSIDQNTQVNKPFLEETFDQLDQFFNTATSLNLGVTVSGGSEKVQFLASLSHLDQESVINGNLRRNNFKANITTKLSDKFKVSSNTTLISSDNTTGGVTGENSVFSGLGSSMNVPQYVNNEALDASGNFVATPTGDNSVNPFFSFRNRIFNSDLRRIIQNINLNYKPFHYLELDYKYGIDNYNNRFRDFQRNQSNLLTSGLPPVTGTLIERPDEGTTQNSLLSAFLRLNTKDDFDWNLDLASTTQIAYDWRKEDFSRITVTGINLPSFTDNINLNQTGEQSATAFDSEFVTFGVLLNQKIDFGNYFGFSGGVRVDWSSAFGQGSDPFIFPRGDAYVRVDQFFENEIINQFKLRAAYGEAGIQPGAFERIAILNAGQIDNTPALSIPSTLRNADLGVEVSKELEFGTDVSITPNFKGNWFNRFDLSATYYNRDSEDVIRALDISPSQGASAILTNAISIETKGFQASLNMNVVEKEDFRWNSTVNFGTFKSDIIEISNGEDIALGNNHVLKEGAPVGAFFGLEPLASLDQTRRDGTRYIEETSVGDYEVGPRGFVVNRTTKRAILTDEQSLIGDPTPDFSMSFIQNLEIFNDLSLSFQLDWVKGNQIYNQSKQWLYRDLIHEDVSVPVTINGETGAWGAFYSNLYDTNNPNSAFVEDGSFIRLRNVSLSYDFGRFIDYFDTIKLSLTGTNLVTWTDYSGLDPEAASNFNDPVERGLDQYAFPNFSTFSLGFNIEF